MYRDRVKSVFLAILVTSCSAEAELQSDQNRPYVTARAQLTFSRQADGQVFADFELNFRTPKEVMLCVRHEMLPESGDFDATLIKFHGPEGEVAASDPALTPRRGPPDIAKYAMRFLAFRQNTSVTLGVRVGKSDYLFRDPGSYIAEFAIPVYDCSKLASIADYDDSAHGWYLGDLVASASAKLN